MRVLLLDNFDSFTWNLHHLLEPLLDTVDVVRNDAITVDEAARYAFMTRFDLYMQRGGG